MALFHMIEEARLVVKISRRTLQIVLRVPCARAD